MDSIKRYLHFVKPYRFQIIATIVIGVIKFAIPLLIPLLLKYVVDDIIDNDALSKGRKLMISFLLLPLCSSFLSFCGRRLNITGSILPSGLQVKFYMIFVISLFTHIQKLSFKYYSNTKTGEVISRVINDVEQTKTFVVTGLMNVWLDLATVFIAIAIMFTMDVSLTIVSIIVLPLYIFSVKYFFGRLRKLTRKRSQALAEVQSYLHERVQGMPVIKSFAIEDVEQKKFDQRE